MLVSHVRFGLDPDPLILLIFLQLLLFFLQSLLHPFNVFVGDLRAGICSSNYKKVDCVLKTQIPDASSRLVSNSPSKTAATNCFLDYV